MTYGFIGIVIASLALLAQGQAPPGWDATERAAMKQMLDGNTAAAIASLEKVVAAHPDFGEAHSILASAHSIAAERLEGDGAAGVPARRAHLEQAAVHLRRAVELTNMNRVINLMSLAEVYGPAGLARPAETERYAQMAVKEFPAGHEAGVLLAWALATTGRTDAASAALKATRGAADADAQLRLAASIIQTVEKVPAGSTPVAKLLLDEAVAIGDEAMKATPANGEAFMLASVALETQAKRAEPDPARKAAMLDRAKKLWERGRELNGAAAAAAPAAGGPPPIPEKWFGDSEKARALEAAGKPAEALKIYEKYMAADPSFGFAFYAAASTHEAMADAIKATAAPAVAERRRHFEAAVALYTRLAGLSSDPAKMPSEFLPLVNLYAADRLNRPADADALTRDAVARYPADAASHALRIQFLLASHRAAEIAPALAAARAAVPATADEQHRLGVYLHEVVNRDKTSNGPEGRQVLAAASSALDAALKVRPDYMEALVYKSLVLRLQASRFEPDAAKQKALIAEADRLRTRAMELQRRKDP